MQIEGKGKTFGSEWLKFLATCLKHFPGISIVFIYAVARWASWFQGFNVIFTNKLKLCSDSNFLLCWYGKQQWQWYMWEKLVKKYVVFWSTSLEQFSYLIFTMLRTSYKIRHNQKLALPLCPLLYLENIFYPSHHSTPLLLLSLVQIKCCYDQN